MQLLIISHTPHYRRDGQIVGWAPTIRELDRLATRFDRVRHVACLHPEAAPGSAIAYTASNIELVPVPPSGAEGLVGKLDVLRTAPAYLRTIHRELASADMVHVRAPAHIALMAMLFLSGRKQPRARWFKYAGNWQPPGREALSYHFQRWWLSRPFHRGVVTVNGDWPEQPRWVRPFFNPSLDDEDVRRGQQVAGTKTLGRQVQLLYVGRVEHEKGTGRAIRILAGLRTRGVDAALDIIGDGDERPTFEALALELGVADRVRFRGWQPPAVVHDAYAKAHFLLLPTAACEGWPKVLSEGMAYGAVPVAGAVSAIPQYLADLRTGAALPPDAIEEFVDTIARYVTDPARWANDSARAVAGAHSFTFSHYLSAIDTLLRDVGLSASHTAG